MALTQPQATQLVTIMRDAIVARESVAPVGVQDPGVIRSRVAAFLPAQLATFDSLMAAAGPADVNALIAGAVAAAGVT